MKKNIFVALDFSDLDKALHVSNLVKDYAAGLKITNELFAICGREGIKKFSNWPTIPQLYVKEEFIGGCDIVKEMHETGELMELFNSRGIDVKPS